MTIKILGLGCPNCQKLAANTQAAVNNLGIDAAIEKITDLTAITGYGVLGLPALVVDEEVKLFGKVASAKEIEGILKLCLKP